MQDGYRIEVLDLEQRSPIKEKQVHDLVRMFHDGGIRSFLIKDGIKGRGRHIHGLHQYAPFSRRHDISLSIDNIRSDYYKATRMGGNMPAPSLKMAVAMVLVHEIQHANQVERHGFDEKFYKTRSYEKRPCEREARARVDDNMHVIAAMLEEPNVTMENCSMRHESKTSCVDEVIATFEHCQRVDAGDITEELRRLGANSPAIFEEAAAALEDMGVKIV